MSFSSFTANNTFFEWLTGYNSVTVQLNRMIEGIYQTTGNITITNASTTSPLGLEVISGNVKAPLYQVGPGTLTAPSIHNYGNGNTSTGINFPGSNNMVLVTGANNVLFVANTRRIGILSNSPTYDLDLTGTFRNTSDLYTGGKIGVGTTSPSYNVHIVGALYATGNVVAESDIRSKENIEILSSALEKVMKLQGVSFNKIGETSRKIGLIAQDVQKVVPEVIDSDEKGYLAINYSVLVALLIEAIKEMNSKKCGCGCK